MENKEEIWKDLPGYEGSYQCSNIGRIRCLDRYVRFVSKLGNVSKVRVNGKIIKQKLTKRGYMIVAFALLGVRKEMHSHRAILSCFVDNPENKLEVNHINGIKTDNRVENLEWCTRLENAQHAQINGRYKGILKGGKHGMSKLNEEKVLHIRSIGNDYLLKKELSKKYNVCMGTINDILARRRWKHV